MHSTVFESSVNSEDSKTHRENLKTCCWFESSVNSEDSKTLCGYGRPSHTFESSVNSEDSKTEILNGVSNT